MLLGCILFCIFGLGCERIWWDKYGDPRIGRDGIGRFRCCCTVSDVEISHHLHDDEFAAAERAHQEKCTALQKQVDDEEKSRSTDGLIVTIVDSSGEICK